MRKKISFIIIAGLLLAGCSKYLDKALPSGTISSETAFSSDNAISSVVTGVFMNMQNSGVFGSATGSNFFLLSAEYVDEMINISTLVTNAVAYYNDEIQYTNVGAWSNLYSIVYDINSTLEGIQGTNATLYYKNQWLGECYYLRAMQYFYLTNMYGDVPLALTSNAVVNNSLSRAPQALVYQQIIADLKQAKALLNPGYTDAYGAGTTHRDRPNTYAAAGLMARAFLYMNDWDSAEAAADTVIAHTSLYSLSPLASVFLANSTEMIWGLAPNPTGASNGYRFYNNGLVSSVANPAAILNVNVQSEMQPALVASFEPGDARRTNWVRSVYVQSLSDSAYFPNKYTSSATGTSDEIYMRLAEIYLIRAEARAHLNELADAAADINVVRARAGLSNTTATDQRGLLNAIAQERKVEFFTENAQRFFDLKRTGKIDSVMTAFAPTKGANITWSSFMSLLPIPSNDLIQDPNLKANPGYQQ